jgi:hypothetical protein
VTTIVLAVAVAVALACPAHMLWRMRRGRQASCMPPRDDANAISRRQARLAEEVDRLTAGRR